MSRQVGQGIIMCNLIFAVEGHEITSFESSNLYLFGHGGKEHSIKYETSIAKGHKLAKAHEYF